MITLGSPIRGNPKSTNAWRIYELASGQRVDDPGVPPPPDDAAAGADHVDLQPQRRHRRLAVQRGAAWASSASASR